MSERTCIGALPGVALEIRLDDQELAEHLDRVAVDVQMVIRILLDPSERFQLRQHAGGGPEPIQEIERVNRIVGANQQAQLRQAPLPRRLRGAAGRGAREVDGPWLNLEPKRARDPRGADQPQWIVRERPVRGRAEDPGLGVGDSAGGIDRVCAGVGQRHCDRVHREVPKAQIGLDVRGPEPCHVQVPRVVAGLHPPRSELFGKLKRRGTSRLCDGAGAGFLSPRFDGEIDVDHLAAEQCVADGAPDDPASVDGIARNTHPWRAQ